MIDIVTSSLITKCGGIPWILKHPLMGEFYLGLDSGGEKDKRSWSSAFIFDEFGESISSQNAKGFSKEGLPKDDIKELILKAYGLHQKRKNEQLKNLIIHRDGFITESEMEGLRDALSLLQQQGAFSPRFFCSVVNIKKGNNFRLFNWKNGHAVNPIIGSYIKLDDSRAVLCTTGHPVLTQSTAKPLLIEVKNMIGRYQIDSAVRDIFNLSELNWGSPKTGFRMPVTIYYAEKMIEFSEFTHKPSYLPI